MENLESVSSSSAVADVLQNGFASHTRTHAEILARDYEIKNPAQVAEFIGENLFLLDLLEEIPAQIRRFFGAEQKLRLEFFWNPEDPNWHQLHVLVPTKLSVDEAFSVMENFDEAWWLKNFARADMKLQVLKEYIR